MFEPTTIAIVAALAVLWGIQVFLSTLQMRRFHKRSQQLRRQGAHMAVGVAGNMYKRKVYVVVVVDTAGKVSAAEQLSGFTIFASLRPIPDMEGRDVWEIGRGEPPPKVSAKTWAAVDHAAGFIRKKIDPIRAAAEERDAEEVG